MLSTTVTVYAQQEGIKFVKNLSWSQIKEKAKQENKYIFVDAYTTWCLPCRVMTNEIFPQQAVGEFFNKNFINVAAQFDVTKKDNQEVKNWYKDAEALQKMYKVDSYPTYLFFNPQGELVHKIFGASPTAEEFITKSKEALDPKFQYLSLKRQYEAGMKKPEFLLILLKSAIQNKDKEFIEKLAAEYYSTQKDLLTKDNIMMLAVTTRKSSDPGFAIFKNNSDQADLTLGKGKSAAIVRTILFDEIALAFIRAGGKKTYHGGGMISYSGTLNEVVDWKGLKIKLDSLYPELSEEIMIFAKIGYFEMAKNWAEYSLAVSELLAKYKNRISTDDLNHYAGLMLWSSDDKKSLEEASKWAKYNLAAADEDKKLMCMYQYSNLLYKSGDKDGALKLVEEAIEITSGKDQYFVRLLEKMKKGEKTW